jgi:hypothetical protein
VKVGGSKSSLELCEESTEVRRAEKGPEAPFMLFLAGAQTSSYLHKKASSSPAAAVRFFE